MACHAKKIIHATQVAAWAALQSLVEKDPHDPRNPRLHAYWCPHCPGWHVGHIRKVQPPKPAAPAPKQPSPHDLRRAEKHAAKIAARKSERALKYADWAETMRHVAFLIERDFASRAR
jgi:hypothetical protein